MRSSRLLISLGMVVLTLIAVRCGAAAAPAPLPEGVTVARNVNYAGTANPAQTLDLIMPKKPRTARPLPVIIGIHGGAFRSGDKSEFLATVARFVATGDYAGVTINYRLSGEAIWPAQINDCKAAVRWVRANARKFNFDPGRVGVIGASAGGHLVAMLGTSGGVAELEGKVGPNKSADSRVQCVVDEFGPSELLTMGDYPSRMNHNAPDSPESLLMGGALQDHKDAAKAASPITYVSHDDPPFLIIHGDEDPLVPFNQSERLNAALKKAGVNCLFIRVRGAGHGGFRNPEVPRRIAQFFDLHLRGIASKISEAPVPNAAR